MSPFHFINVISVCIFYCPRVHAAVCVCVCIRTTHKVICRNVGRLGRSSGLLGLLEGAEGNFRLLYHESCSWKYFDVNDLFISTS